MDASSFVSNFIEEHCPIGISQHQPGGDFVAASTACARLFSVDKEALIGRNLFTLVGAAEPVLRDAFAQACATRSERRVRFLYPRLEGAPLWIQATIRPVCTSAPDDTAAASCIIVCCQDMTAEAQAERDLRERLEQAEQAERHRDFLVKLTPGLIWYGPVSPDLSAYRAAYLNDYLFRVTGYTAEQWMQTPGFWRSIIHPDDRERILSKVATSLASGEVMGPYRIRTSDGRYLWIQSQMLLERDADGVPRRVYGLTIDMTSFKQAEAERMAALERVEVLSRRIDALVSTLPGIVWERWLEPAHEPKNFCSEYVQVLTGYDKADWTAGPDGFLRFVPAASREAVGAALTAVMKNGGGSLQHKLVTRDGRELWLENHIIAVRDEHGTVQCLRGIALDLTASKQAEEKQLALQQAIAGQAQQLLELSTPLIPISDDVLVLPLIGTLDPARAQHALDALLDGVARLRVRKVLVDLTGVVIVDAVGAVALLRMIHATGLIGAHVILTGMRPEIALAFSKLEVELGAISTRSSLRAAVLEFVAHKKPALGRPAR